MFTIVVCKDTKEVIYTYQEYLLSDHWRNFREEYIKVNGDSCELCGEHGKELHHIYYENLGNESFDDVILLCVKCHRKEHKDVFEEFNL